MSPVQLADELEQFRLALDMFRDELEPGRIRQIRETTKSARAFLKEARRQGFTRDFDLLRNPYDRAEAAINQVQERFRRWADEASR